MRYRPHIWQYEGPDPDRHVEDYRAIGSEVLKTLLFHPNAEIDCAKLVAERERLTNEIARQRGGASRTLTFAAVPGLAYAAHEIMTYLLQ